MKIDSSHGIHAASALDKMVINVNQFKTRKAKSIIQVPWTPLHARFKSPWAHPIFFYNNPMTIKYNLNKISNWNYVPIQYFNQSPLWLINDNGMLDEIWVMILWRLRSRFPTSIKIYLISDHAQVQEFLRVPYKMSLMLLYF